MNVIKHQQVEREVHRIQASRGELVERIAQAAPEDGHIEPLQGLHLYRRSVPREPGHSVTKASFCVIAQGSKEVLCGETRYRYDPLHYLLATIAFPSISHVLSAYP